MKIATGISYSKDYPSSRALYDRARAVIPGGSSRGSIFYQPYPLFAIGGTGCRLMLEDGVEVVDFLNNFTTLVLGHRYPDVIDAVASQLSLGTTLGAHTEAEVELAELFVSKMPSVDQMVYTTTGSEAVMLGLRLARAVSGRPDIAKFEGGYHGGYDHAKVSAMVGPERWGDAVEPRSVLDTAGIPSNVADQVHIMQFNSLESVSRVLSREKGRIGVLVMEPVLGAGGMLPAPPAFLSGVRQLCDDHGVILLFDEVITQRLHVGGVQGLTGVLPDLTVVSKVMGGGFPIAALGGRADLMRALDPTMEGGPTVYHSGTYNGNPLCVAGALATMRALNAGRIDYINRLGEAARAGMEEVIGRNDISASVTGSGSLFNVHFTSERPTEYRAVRKSDRATLARFHLGMLERGVLLATRGMGCISTPMVESDVDRLLDAADETLASMSQ